MKSIVAIVHQPSANTQLLADACREGFEDAQKLSDVSFDFSVLTPQEVDSALILKCDALFMVSTENFGYMAGLIKDLFERIYYDVLEEKQGLPFALAIRAGLDGTGARTSIESIISALRWSLVKPPLVLKGEWKDSFFDEAKELATYISLGTAEGIF